MKITPRAIELLSGILSTCMFEKGYLLSDEQKNFLKTSSDSDLDSFLGVFPLEQETKEKLVDLAKSLGKGMIDPETVLSFFGGDLHIDHAREDVAENGLTRILADLFLVFHVVLPVRLTEIDGKIVGEYVNGGIHLQLRGLEKMDNCDPDVGSSGRKALIHYGSVFGSVSDGCDEEKFLLASQSRSDFFRSVCGKIRYLDCEKMLKALQFKKRACHSNVEK